MKTLNSPATYESPIAEVMILETEGALCDIASQITHDPFSNGGDLEF